MKEVLNMTNKYYAEELIQSLREKDNIKVYYYSDNHISLIYSKNQKNTNFQRRLTRLFDFMQTAKTFNIIEGIKTTFQAIFNDGFTLEIREALFF